MLNLGGPEPRMTTGLTFGRWWWPYLNARVNRGVVELGHCREQVVLDLEVEVGHPPVADRAGRAVGRVVRRVERPRDVLVLGYHVLVGVAHLAARGRWGRAVSASGGKDGSSAMLHRLGGSREAQSGKRDEGRRAERGRRGG